MTPPRRAEPACARRIPWALLAMASAPALLPGCRCSRPLLSRGDAAAVVVRGTGPAGPADLPGVLEQEPNGRLAAPMPIPFEGSGVVVRGSLAFDGDSPDEDAFLLRLPGGTDAGPTDPRPPATSRLSIEVLPGPGLITTFDLRDGKGMHLAGSRGAAGQRHGLPDAPAPPGAEYILQLTGKLAGDGGAKGSAARAPAAGEYALVLRLVPLEGGDEREPNDRV